jgi:hypothetical protein
MNFASAANTMGVVTTIAIDPKQITLRVRNKVIRNLEQGLLEGGYRSEARKLSDLLVQAFELDVSSNTWTGISVRNPTPEMKAALLELRKADWAAYTLENPARGRIGQWDYRRMVTDLEQLESNAEGSFYLHFEDKTCRRMAAEVIKKSLSPELKVKVQNAVAALRGTDLIPVRGDFS